ncbi:hypothetical protein AURDEDRAFT_181694 [Auricularia subglabra TFB-10046 SS5]|nr:hypothetical protein AURDEDRAFT_181694 [Auricularia subglabra TFB-10046 SS5]
MGRSQPEASSSSSTLWAQASKEWVIPPRPKPGRKPKKPAAEPVVEDELSDDDGSGRKSQNRVAQRAFRERKQSQLAELQARLQEYEQGEVERSVHLQSIAKKLKDENDALKDENSRLKAEVARLMATSLSAQDDRLKRSHDEFSAGSLHMDSFSMETMRKRLKSRHPSGDMVPTLPPISFLPTPPSDASTPESSSSVSAFSPAAAYPSPAGYPTPSSSATGTGAHGYSHPDKPFIQREGPVLKGLDCILCTDGSDCICGDQRPDLSGRLSSSNLHLDVQGRGPDSVKDFAPPVTEPLASTSVLDNLPPYQPAVPLPRRNNAVAPAERVFKYTTVQAPLCTGDPSNCPACADDPFGQAFCAALGDAVCANPDCKNCSGRAPANAAPASSGPHCSHGPNCNCGTASASVAALSSGHPEIQQPQPSKAIPTNCAWSQLKSHPNVAFADLRLLAEVVAGKQRCTGPRVLFSPPPVDAFRGRTTDSHRQISSASQPSRETSCSRPPVVEVQSSNVREALAILDGHAAAGLHMG